MSPLEMWLAVYYSGVLAAFVYGMLAYPRLLYKGSLYATGIVNITVAVVFTALMSAFSWYSLLMMWGLYRSRRPKRMRA